MATGEETDPAAVDSIWWYGVAFAAVWGVIAWVQFVLVLSTPGAAQRAGELIVLTVAVLVIHPIAIYLDVDAIRRSGVDWSPNLRLYLAGALVGIPATVFTTFVAAAYLYRRHRHVGTP